MSKIDDILSLIDEGLTAAERWVCWRCEAVETSGFDEACVMCRFDLAGSLYDMPLGPYLENRPDTGCDNHTVIMDDWIGAFCRLDDDTDVFPLQMNRAIGEYRL